jgi:hypothetical protein
MALALGLALTATVSGGLGALPWDWHKRLCDGQEHTGYRQIFQHDAKNVSHISVLERGFDGKISGMIIVRRIIWLVDWGRRVQFVYQMADLALATSAGGFVRAYLIAHTHIAPIWRPPLYIFAFAVALLISALVGNWLHKRIPLGTSQLKPETNQESAMFSPLQLEALEVRHALQVFLKSQPVIDRNAFDGPLAEREAKWRTACHQRDRKVRAAYELKFKDRAIKVFNLFVINDLRDDHLASLAWNADSIEDVQDLIDTIWKATGQVNS